MWTREEEANLDPYFRAIYLLELIAALTIVAGMFLVWWKGEGRYTLFDVLGQSLDQLRARSPHVIGQPTLVLWLLWPVVLAGGLRGMTGVLVAPVSYRRLALAACGLALVVLAHFYVNFGRNIPAHSPLKGGQIQIGFWLTSSSTAILTLLVLAEGQLRPRRDPFAASGPAAPVDDAERLWRGEYQTCPYCGMLNEPGAKSCYNCHNLLFDFMRDKRDRKA